MIYIIVALTSHRNYGKLAMYKRIPALLKIIAFNSINLLCIYIYVQDGSSPAKVANGYGTDLILFV